MQDILDLQKEGIMSESFTKEQILNNDVGNLEPPV